MSKGRGGLPQNPSASINGEAIWQDLRAQQIQSDGPTVSQGKSQSSAQVTASVPAQWVEANTWQRLPNGTVKLMADARIPRNFPTKISC